MEDGRIYGGPENGRRYQPDRDIATVDNQQPSKPYGALSTDNRTTAFATGSTNHREQDREEDSQSYHKTSDERNRSRTQGGRITSGQVRICKKCGEPLTGQFVRAIGGTFHLDCFKCRVCE